ncbi:MAG: hypothetical protein ACOYXR_06070 [Nitrospirota bacterium]
MSSREEKRKRMKELARESARRTDDLLESDLEALKKATQSDLDALRPKVTDSETYDRLVEAVNESTRRNESLAELKARLEKLGGSASQLVKEAVRLLRP